MLNFPWIQEKSSRKSHSTMKSFKPILKESVPTKIVQEFSISQTQWPTHDAHSAKSSTAESVISATMLENVHHINFNSSLKHSIIVSVPVAKIWFKKTMDAITWLAGANISFATCVEISGKAHTIAKDWEMSLGSEIPGSAAAFSVLNANFAIRLITVANVCALTNGNAVKSGQ